MTQFQTIQRIRSLFLTFLKMPLAKQISRQNQTQHDYGNNGRPVPIYKVLIACNNGEVVAFRKFVSYTNALLLIFCQGQSLTPAIKRYFDMITLCLIGQIEIIACINALGEMIVYSQAILDVLGLRLKQIETDVLSRIFFKYELEYLG